MCLIQECLIFAGGFHLDTFQLIAFLLSAFNLAGILTSNVNNNNNNNNVNSNSNNVNDNNINESNTNADVNSMVSVGLGGRRLTRRAAVDLAEVERKEETEVEELGVTVQELCRLVLRSHLSPSVSCLERLQCEAGDTAARRGGFSLVAAELAGLLLARALPRLTTAGRQRVERSARAGRAGLNCTNLYTECRADNWNFINIAETFTWSPVAELKRMEKLVAWAYTK